MKHIFLPDENVLMRALKCHEPAREFWETIALNCHKIAVNEELADRYWRRLRQEKKLVNSHFPNIPRIINMLLRNSEKCDFRADVNPVPEETIVRHENDRYLLRIVAAGNEGGLLVTTDTKTRNDFNKPAISNKYKTAGLAIEKALALARER